MDRQGGRDRDRAELPEPMRRDVRLLGDLLGEVIRDSDPKTGPDLLADVERLRRAVIEARRGSRDDPAGDHIAGLVASWDLDRAEQVARAFTVYFHLVNLAEEHQRIRFVRERDAGADPRSAAERAPITARRSRSTSASRSGPADSLITSPSTSPSSRTSRRIRSGSSAESRSRPVPPISLKKTSAAW